MRIGALRGSSRGGFFIKKDDTTGESRHSQCQLTDVTVRSGQNKSQKQPDTDLKVIKKKAK